MEYRARFHYEHIYLYFYINTCTLCFCFRNWTSKFLFNKSNPSPIATVLPVIQRNDDARFRSSTAAADVMMSEFSKKRLSANKPEDKFQQNIALAEHEVTSSEILKDNQTVTKQTTSAARKPPQVLISVQ